MAHPGLTNMHIMKWLDADRTDGLKQGLLIGAAVLVLLLPPARTGWIHAPAVGGHPVVEPIHRQLDFAGQTSSREVREVAEWVVSSADNGSVPFAILDKRNAHVFVFDAGGRLQGSTPVLLGYAAGDDSVAGIGRRPIADVRPEERTTPAGRFVAEPGRNAINEDVVWVDYEAAVSMHRVRLNNPSEHRLERLASPTVSDNRISYGCINMPPEFFENVLWPNFRGRHGVVYVLPEVKPLAAVFPALARSSVSRAILPD